MEEPGGTGYVLRFQIDAAFLSTSLS